MKHNLRNLICMAVIVVPALALSPFAHAGQLACVDNMPGNQTKLLKAENNVILHGTITEAMKAVEFLGQYRAGLRHGIVIQKKKAVKLSRKAQRLFKEARKLYLSAKTIDDAQHAKTVERQATAAQAEASEALDRINYAKSIITASFAK